jgi:hypothetical protein
VVSPGSKKEKAGHKRRYMMRIKALNSISRVSMVLMILSIIPSCAFASENGTQTSLTNQSDDLKFGHAFGFLASITGENFTDVKVAILDSISKRIAELQSLYNDVSKSSNASALQEVLSDHRKTNECMGPDGMNIRSGHMHMGLCGINGFNLDLVENVTDENFTAVQTKMLNSLQNMTHMLKDQQNHTKVGQDNNRTEELNKKITELQNLYTEVSEASTAAELKEVVFAYMQTQAVDSIEKEIEHLQARINESENTSDGNTSDGNTSDNQLSSRITELTALKENINNAESLEDLKKVLPSSRGMHGMGENPMHHRGHERCGCHMDYSGRVQDNTADDTADNTADNSTDYGQHMN